MAALGFGHEQLGLELARRWELPLTTRMTIGFHHRPLPDKTDGSPLGKVLRVADWMGCEYGIGYTDLARSQEGEYAAVRQQLGLSANDETDIIRSVALELKQMEKASWFTQYRARVPLCA
jgi:HD-like signal output (HDOD) protein